MERLTTRHNGVAVIKDKSRHKEAMEKLARYEEPITNADCIRAMSDEELAMNIMCPNENGLANIACDKSDNCNCYECLLNWLKAEVDIDDKRLTTCLEDLNLSVRAYNCLRRAGIDTTEDLCSRTPNQMLRIRDLGRKTLEEIMEKMEQNGLKFRTGVD